MRIRTFRCLSVVLASAILVFALGCGSASNNDQGVSFALISLEPTSDELPIGSTNDSGAAGVTAGYTLQNNISTQGIRVQRVFLRYFIEGATAQPPSTTIPLSVVLGASGGDGNSSLPDGFGGPPEATVTAFLVPPDIYTWVSLNRNSLPEPPFLMTVEAYASGITTAGDRLETNPLATGITFIPEVIIDPDEESGEASEEFEESEEF